MSRTEKEYLSNKLKVLILIIQEDIDISLNEGKYVKYLKRMIKEIAS